MKKNTGILVNPETNEFLCLINNIDSFIICCKQIDFNSIGLNKDRISLQKYAFNLVEKLDSKINDIGIHETCHVTITENYDGKGMIVISIFGDNGIVTFGIITNPIKFD